MELYRLTLLDLVQIRGQRPDFKVHCGSARAHVTAATDTPASP
ncbi:hypothetical protein [Dinoroseobacter sp. S76]